MIPAEENTTLNGVGRLSGNALLTPLLLRAAEAAALCGTSPRTWRTWDATGRIPKPVRIGRNIFWRPGELNAWVAAGCPDRTTWQAIQES
jgi:predicted DNA-binding transcriptional regulator AlpA